MVKSYLTLRLHRFDGISLCVMSSGSSYIKEKIEDILAGILDHSCQQQFPAYVKRIRIYVMLGTLLIIIFFTGTLPISAILKILSKEC